MWSLIVSRYLERCENLIGLLTDTDESRALAQFFQLDRTDVGTRRSEATENVFDCYLK